MHADLTLHEAADLLGVHYMTAYRYVRLGQLHASKVGGTWRVTGADIEAFRAGGIAPRPDGGGRQRAPWAERLESRLVAGDGRGAWTVVESAMAAGTEPDAIYTDVLGPAMASIGLRWEAGELDIAVEHRATGIALRLVGRLGPRFVRRGRTRGTVLLAAPEGERHALPVAMLADLVRYGGWEVSDLGADTPVHSLIHAAAEHHDLVAIGLSVTTPACLPAASAALEALRHACPGVLLVAGGWAVQDEQHASALGAHAYAASANEMTRLLGALPDR